MSLEALIYRKRRGAPIAAALAADFTATVAKTVDVQNVEAAIDSPIVPPDCIGALVSRDGGLYLPWAPYMVAADVQRMRRELVASIAELSTLEQWSPETLNSVMTAATRGPLSALASDFAHFGSRLLEARAELAMRGTIDRIAKARQ